MNDGFGSVGSPGTGHSGLLGSSVGETWDAFKQDAVLFIVAWLIVAAISIVSLGILAGPMYVGFIDVVRRRRRGEAVGVGEVFDGVSTFGTSFGVVLIVVVAALIGFLLLVLPGFLVLIATSFAFHEVAYRKRGAIDAVKGSVELVKGSFLDVLVLTIIVFALHALGGAVVFGQLITAPFATVLTVIMYEKLSGQARGGSSAGQPELT